MSLNSKFVKSRHNKKAGMIKRIKFSSLSKAHTNATIQITESHMVANNMVEKEKVEGFSLPSITERSISIMAVNSRQEIPNSSTAKVIALISLLSLPSTFMLMLNVLVSVSASFTLIASSLFFIFLNVNVKSVRYSIFSSWVLRILSSLQWVSNFVPYLGQTLRDFLLRCIFHSSERMRVFMRIHPLSVQKPLLMLNYSSQEEVGGELGEIGWVRDIVNLPVSEVRTGLYQLPFLFHYPSNLSLLKSLKTSVKFIV